MKQKIFLILFIILTLFSNIQAWAVNETTSTTVIDKDIQKISEIVYLLKNNHISSPQKSTLIDGAIKGMVNALNDPYAMYMTPEMFNQTLNPIIEYTGIGVTLEQFPGLLVVTKIFSNSPAFKAGIKEGDMILKVNGINIVDIPIEDIVKKIKGKPGTSITIVFKKKNGEIIQRKIIRQKISLPNLEKKIFENDIGYIKLSSFGKNAGNEFNKAFNDLNTHNIKSLIIDLRGNSGGFLGSTQKIISNFIDKGPFVKVVDKSGAISNKDVKGSHWGKPVIILMDENSASAAEVVAGAMQDYKLAKVVGTQSYGKGSMQMTYELETGAMLKLTTNNWLTPQGRSVEGIGIKPDYEVTDPNLQLLLARRMLSNQKDLTLKYIKKDNTWLLGKEETNFYLKPLINKNKSYYPLRFILEAFNFSNTFNQDGTIKVTNQNKTITLLKKQYIIDHGRAFISKEILKTKFQIDLFSNIYSITMSKK